MKSIIRVIKYRLKDSFARYFETFHIFLKTPENLVISRINKSQNIIFKTFHTKAIPAILFFFKSPETLVIFHMNKSQSVHAGR